MTIVRISNYFGGPPGKRVFWRARLCHKLCSMWNALGMPLMRRLLLILSCVGLARVDLAAQPPVGRDNATASAIQEARKQITSGKLTDGLEQLQRIIDTAGDDLV